MRKSHVSRTSLAMPSPSLPMTIAMGPVKSASVCGLAPSAASRPAIHTPPSFSASRLVQIFGTRDTRMCSEAPADARTAAGVTPAARRSGTMTPCTPAASAVRKSEPRFCGSRTWSRTRRNGGSASSGSDSTRSRNATYGYDETSAAIP